MKWICTDPDQHQFRQDKGEDVWNDTKFTFKERGEVMTIDLKSYTNDKLNAIMSSYGYKESLEEVDGKPKHTRKFFDCTGTEVDNSILAECCFEYELN